MAVTLNGADITDQLASDWAPAVLKEGISQSVVAKLAPRKPMPLTGINIPIFEDKGGFGFTEELGRKPVSDVKLTAPVIKPKKFARLIPVSEEAAIANPGSMLEAIRDMLVSGVADQTDLAVLHGQSVFDGKVIEGITYVGQTKNKVELDLAKPFAPQILAGYDLAAATRGSHPNGWALDHSLRTRVAQATQSSGVANAENVIPNLAGATDYVAGLPAAYSPAISGDVASLTATDTLGFVGDWSKVYWGYGRNLNIRTFDQATIELADGSTIHAAQDNAIIVRAEFELGWVITDPDAFAKYTKKAQ